MAEVYSVTGLSMKWVDLFASLCDRMHPRDAKRELFRRMEEDPDGARELAEMRAYAEQRRRGAAMIPADVQALLAKQRAARVEALRRGEE